MGHYSRRPIERAGRHLLDLLRTHGSVRYSTAFFDGTEETARRVAEVVQAVGKETPETAFGIAAAQLEKAGWVKRSDQGEEMVDGEPDYEISLTPLGRDALTGDDVEFHFHAVML